MRLQGTVLSWKDGVARVHIAVNPCSACSHRCGAHSSGGGGRYLLVECSTPLEPGRAIVVEAPLPSPAHAVALAYLLPLAGFMAGLFIGNARLTEPRCPSSAPAWPAPRRPMRGSSVDGAQPGARVAGATEAEPEGACMAGTGPRSLRRTSDPRTGGWTRT